MSGYRRYMLLSYSLLSYFFSCFRTQFPVIECPSTPRFSELVRRRYGVGTEKVYRKMPHYPSWGNWSTGATQIWQSMR